jgi:hypothetical protein
MLRQVNGFAGRTDVAYPPARPAQQEKEIAAMFKRCAILLVVVMGITILAPAVSAQTPKLVTGRIKALTVTNPEYQRGLTRQERRYPINLYLDSHPNFLLGLAFDEKRGMGLVDHEIYLLLKLAFENDLPVVIRWRSDVSHTGQYPDFARIVSAQLQR